MIKLAKPIAFTLPLADRKARFELVSLGVRKKYFVIWDNYRRIARYSSNLWMLDDDCPF